MNFALQGMKPNSATFDDHCNSHPQKILKKILVIAGETSGDQHGAHLVEGIKQLYPQAYFLGIGGEKMRNAGVDVIVDNSKLAVVGGIEVLKHFRHIHNAWKKMRVIISTRSVDLIILIDYPGFNLRLAKIAKKANIKVLYYISPQVWAWKSGRIKTIKKYVDKMLVIFPFEEILYQRANVPVEFVGHPLAGHVHASMDEKKARHFFGINPNTKVIGLLPGSRKGEIERLLPVMIAAAEKIKQYDSQIQFVLPLASSLTQEDINAYLTQHSIDIKIISGHFYDVLQICNAAIVTSGTATLETALMGIPMVIVYKITALTYFLAKKVIKIPYIGLCNIVADKKIVQELIQKQANADAISTEIIKILEDQHYREVMLQNLSAVREKLGKHVSHLKAAEAAVRLLKIRL